MKNAKEEIMCEDATKLAEMSQENFVKDGRVYIMGPFDRSISSKVIPDFIGLIDCIRFSKQPAIEIFINSGGGYSSELYALLSVIDMAKEEGIKIVTYNMGIAGSCASMLAVVGDERYMSRFGVNYPHLGQTSYKAETFEQMERENKRVKDWMNQTVDIDAAHTKIKRAQLMKFLADDNWNLNVDECLKYGFCDKVIGFEKQQQVQAGK